MKALVVGKGAEKFVDAVDLRELFERMPEKPIRGKLKFRFLVGDLILAPVELSVPVQIQKKY